jgi:L-fucose mutarotase
MLKGISPLISPELLALLSRMGHGDQIVLADAHFPGESTNSRCIRADGLLIADLLDAILPLFELDFYIDAPLLMMAPVDGDALDPSVEASYDTVVKKWVPQTVAISRLERFAFYGEAASAFAVVMTGDTAKYGNLILTKGVTPS